MPDDEVGIKVGLGFDCKEIVKRSRAYEWWERKGLNIFLDWIDILFLSCERESLVLMSIYLEDG